MSELDISTALQLPLDAVAETFAIMGIRGAGKTTTAKRIAEQMCMAGLPWIALDPVGVWWGLRANVDGTPSDLPIVVFGGKKADLPLERDKGREIARAIINENICAVIDMHGESKAFWRTFLVDFCLELMQIEPDHPHHVFIEEAPEFVPQRGRSDLTARTKEAVERLVRLGRNQGYGCTLVTQRPATVDKDVLSQCENLFVMKTVGKHDRKALDEWLEAQGQEEMKFTGLGKLKPGDAYFWSPSWLEMFELIQVKPSDTFHPGRTRRVGMKAQKAELGDVSGFVSRLSKQLERAPAKSKGNKKPIKQSPVVSPEIERLEEALSDADARIEELTATASAAVLQKAHLENGVAKAAALLQPFAEAHAVLTGELEAVGAASAGATANRAAWEPWLAKAGDRGVKRRIFDTLLEHGERTKRQLATLSNTSVSSSTFRNAMTWFRKNGLLQEDGERVRLADVA